tara:strand:- start:656 stop:844 length:189 start_codon:yes stop_codon:yes gene_type:complete
MDNTLEELEAKARAVAEADDEYKATKEYSVEAKWAKSRAWVKLKKAKDALALVEDKREQDDD